MIKPGAVIGAVVAAGALSASGFVLASSPPHRSSAPSLVEVCLTVTPKSVSVSINGITIGNPPVGVSRNCIGV